MNRDYSIKTVAMMYLLPHYYPPGKQDVVAAS